MAAASSEKQGQHHAYKEQQGEDEQEKAVLVHLGALRKSSARFIQVPRIAGEKAGEILTNFSPMIHS